MLNTAAQPAHHQKAPTRVSPARAGTQQHQDTLAVVYRGCQVPRTHINRWRWFAGHGQISAKCFLLQSVSFFWGLGPPPLACRPGAAAVEPPKASTETHTERSHPLPILTLGRRGGVLRAPHLRCRVPHPVPDVLRSICGHRCGRAAAPEGVAARKAPVPVGGHLQGDSAGLRGLGPGSCTHPYP